MRIRFLILGRRAPGPTKPPVQWALDAAGRRKRQLTYISNKRLISSEENIIGTDTGIRKI